MKGTAIQEFSFGQNDGGFSGGKKRFKMDTDQVARISLAWWPTKQVNGITVLDMDAGPKFIGAPRHYMKGVGYFINQGPEYTKIAGEPPKKRVATIILSWPMTSKGVLDKDAIKAGEFDVVPWVFDDRKYETIKPVHDEWNLGLRDLKIKCTDSQFQAMTFSPCQESLLRNFMEKGAGAEAIIKSIVDQVGSISATLSDEIGKVMTIDQIREKLVGGGGGGGGGGGRAANPAGGESSTDDIDGLVDDLLG